LAVPQAFGVYGGTLTTRTGFERSPEMSKHIFLASAQNGTVIPAGISSYFEHAMRNDGTPIEPRLRTTPYHRSAALKIPGGRSLDRMREAMVDIAHPVTFAIPELRIRRGRALWTTHQPGTRT